MKALNESLGLFLCLKNCIKFFRNRIGTEFKEYFCSTKKKSFQWTIIIRKKYFNIAFETLFKMLFTLL